MSYDSAAWSVARCFGTWAHECRHLEHSSEPGPEHSLSRPQLLVSCCDYDHPPWTRSHCPSSKPQTDPLQ